MNNELGFVCYPCDKTLDNKRTCLEHINSRLCKLGSNQEQMYHAKIVGLVCFTCEKAFRSKIDAALHLVHGNCCNSSFTTSTCTEDNSIENQFFKLKI